MTSTFDERAAEVERALNVIRTIDGNKELQIRAFDYMLGAQVAVAAPKPSRVAEPAQEDQSPKLPKQRTNGAKKGSKSSVSQDKTLVTDPEGVQSWREFAKEKNPINQDDRNVVAVYWLREIAGHEKVNASQVLTLYIDANWKPPANPRNSLQKTASLEGVIDTADMDDIKVAPRGLGRVKNDLPLPDKK
ncbi:MAG: hypothetical protein JWO18_656 [Microbacteriaceae bacterium]|nr:hypothetical protein [Microbacteriaceae bacterium]